MTSDLSTTNLFLGMMAVASVLEIAAVIGLLAALFVAVRRLTRLLESIQARQIAPAGERVQAILDDIKGMTGVVNRLLGVRRG
jgi:hypothetical protein